jgi:hypothetical protein
MIARPGEVLEGVGLAMMLGGPALYLPGENLIERKLTSETNNKRLIAPPATSRRCCSA